jgi:hypothetical protein
MKIIIKSIGREDQTVEVDREVEQVEILVDRRGNPWSKEEDAQFKDEWMNIVQAQITVLADLHQRSCGAIRSRLHKLELLPKFFEYPSQESQS